MSIYDAAYLAIFLGFLRRLWAKMEASLTHEIPFRSEGRTDDFYVLVDGKPFWWSDDRNACTDFCYRAIARCRSLAPLFKIVESKDDLNLVDTPDIPGLSVEECVALNDTVDEYE